MTKLSLNLDNNNVEEIELNKWLEWSEKLVDLSLDLKENKVESGYNDNMNLEDVNDNCEVYANIWDGENEEQYE